MDTLEQPLGRGEGEKVTTIMQYVYSKAQYKSTHQINTQLSMKIFALLDNAVATHKRDRTEPVSGYSCNKITTT